MAALAPVLTRFNVLAARVLPLFLAHLADIPPPAGLALLAGATAPDAASASATPLAAFERLLLAAAFRGVAPLPPGVDAPPAAPAGGDAASASAAGGPAGETQGDRDGRVDGAVSAILSCLAFWRLMFRDPAWHRCGRKGAGGRARVFLDTTLAV